MRVIILLIFLALVLLVPILNVSGQELPELQKSSSEVDSGLNMIEEGLNLTDQPLFSIENNLNEREALLNTREVYLNRKEIMLSEIENRLDLRELELNEHEKVLKKREKDSILLNDIFIGMSNDLAKANRKLEKSGPWMLITFLTGVAAGVFGDEIVRNLRKEYK